MNEKIKQLAEQANLSADKTYQFNPKDGFIIQEWDKIRLEKFAELIIQQCIDQIEIERGNPYRNMGDENKYGISACDQSISRIKRQFEIK